MSDSPPPSTSATSRWTVEEDHAFCEPTPSSSQADPAEPSIPSRRRRDDAATGVCNAPITYTENSAQTFGFDPKNASDQNIRRGQEMLPHILGPMPVEDFLDDFMLASSTSFDEMPSSKDAFVGVTLGSRESDIYKPLIRAINNNKQPRCPGFGFRDTSNHPDTTGGTIGAKKPDVCGYANRHLRAVELAEKLGRDPLVSRTDMGLAATFIEVKPKESDDCFKDPPDDIEPEERAKWKFAFYKLTGKELTKHQEILGQNGAYAAEIKMRQHREFLYSISMSGLTVRLIRWDRAGAIVSASFHIHENPEYLCKFLWCFAHMTDIQRGYDLTVEQAPLAQEELFKTCIKEHVDVQMSHAHEADRRRAVFDHYDPGHVTSIYVPRRVGDEEVIYEYLICRPITIPLSPFGRCGRGYWAVDVLKKRVMFLKDTWRTDVDAMEGSTLLDLQEADVRHVPALEYHCDVPVAVIGHKGQHIVLCMVGERRQTTLTQKYLKAKWLCSSSPKLHRRVVKRTRYRLVVECAGYSLMNCRGSLELFSGAYHALEAMRDAYERCDLLHRDVTAGNIVLYKKPDSEEREGYLIDWELASKKGNQRLAYDPSLSWQFVSIAVGTAMGEKHTIQDDMESLYYVVLYCSLLFLDHSLDVGQLHATLNGLFDFSHHRHTITSACSAKSADCLSGQYTRTIVWKHDGIGEFFAALKKALSMHYARTMIMDLPGVEWSLDTLLTTWNTLLSNSAAPLLHTDRIAHITAEENVDHFTHVAPRSIMRNPYQATTVHHVPLSAESSMADDHSSDGGGATEDRDMIHSSQPRNSWRIERSPSSRTVIETSYTARGSTRSTRSTARLRTAQAAGVTDLVDVLSVGVGGPAISSPVSFAHTRRPGGGPDANRNMVALGTRTVPGSIDNEASAGSSSLPGENQREPMSATDVKRKSTSLAPERRKKPRKESSDVEDEN
ncbi:hypothetical protein C8Q77DRAFT_275036 [Trametes polyzona]|nr:hypothetical protein C8Q77DRAFT_275036 [Trametes polyzona]